MIILVIILVVEYTCIFAKIGLNDHDSGSAHTPTEIRFYEI